MYFYFIISFITLTFSRYFTMNIFDHITISGNHTTYMNSGYSLEFGRISIFSLERLYIVYRLNEETFS